MRYPKHGSGSVGHALGMTLHILLVLAVVGQIVYLGSHFRVRQDITGDQLYTLTDSTRTILSRLDKQLLIEAYFSPDDTVPAAYRESRPNIRNFLDELVQVGNGRVLVQYLNPQEDKELADRARRMGIRPFSLQDRDTTSVSVTELWQGLRLRYGSDKQKVLNPLNPEPRFTGPAQLEMQIIPAIKEVTLEQKANVGFMEWEVEAAGGVGNSLEEQPQSWFNARMMPQVQGRYQFTNLRYTDVLVPDSIDTLILFRPKDLTDREKYIIDQFLMRGKTLVVLADSMEYEIGQNRSFLRRRLAYDAPDSEIKFLDQLAHYGIRVQEKLIADMYLQAHAPLGVLRLAGGFQMLRPIPIYPYFFRPVDLDWGTPQIADRIAAQMYPGDPEVAKRYRELFVPGILRGNPLTEAMAEVGSQPKGGPFFFWACPVELTDPLPEGVQGQEMFHTSPYALLEDPPSNVAPMNFQADPRMQDAYYETWVQNLQARLSEPRRQVSVMAAVRGPFTSYFEGKSIPRAFGEEDPVKVVQDPLELPISPDPLAEPPTEPPEETGPPGTENRDTEAGGRAGAGGTGTDAGNTSTGNTDTGNTDTGNRGAGGTGAEDTETAGPGQRGRGDEREEANQTEADAAAAANPGPADAVAQDPGQEGPPPPPEPQDPPQDPDREADPVYTAVAPGQVVVVGDADFLRDDLIGSLTQGFSYQNIGGPVSGPGRPFFVNMLDWLHQESDLNALHNRNLTRRMLVFAEPGPTEPIDQFNQRLSTKVSVLRWGNILLPPLLLVVLGCVLGLARRSQKKSFLSSVES